MCSPPSNAFHFISRIDNQNVVSKLLMFDRPALAALTAVLDTGSFELAAAKLGLGQPAISARIKQLEENVGAVLVRRTRPVEATAAGRKLQAHAQTLALLEYDLSRDLKMKPMYLDAPLRIAVTADTLASWLLPALPQEDWLFYDLLIDDQDTSVDLLHSGAAAAAITARGEPIAGCDATPLGRLRYVAFASPAFLEYHFPSGPDLLGLELAPALTYSRKDKLQLQWARRVTGINLIRLPTHYLPSTHGITDAAIAGLGWAVNPEQMVTPHFESGALVPMRPDVVLETPLYWQVPRQNREALAGITESLKRLATQAQG